MNDIQKNYIRTAREILVNLQSTFPAITENYKKINEMIAELEALLGY